MGKDDLVRDLIDGGYLRTPIIIEAFKKIDRKDFVLPEYESEAYSDIPLPIGHEQTISQPLTVAFMLELLDPRQGESILDIGTGSGWKAALLAYCVSVGGFNGVVVTVERMRALKDLASRNISRYNFIEDGIIKILFGDGSKTLPKEYLPLGGFDKIISGASGKELPDAWKKELKVGGKIVAPIGNSIFVFNKLSENRFAKKEYYGFSFVPLIEE